MDSNRFYEKLRNFFGYQPVPPTNDFRNPIWGSDDDDDGDELYTREQMEMYNDQIEVHREISKQMQDMFKSFGSIFGDMKSLFHHDTFIDEPVVDEPSEPSNYDSNAIRNYYLKPGYHNRKSEQPRGDVDLDGKISSHEISGLLKKKGSDGGDNAPVMPYGSLVPGRSFCRTIITTSVKKPDGTVETRRIIKNGNEVVEETTTSLGPDSRSPINTGLDAVSSAGVILAEIGSLFKNFY